MKVMTLALLTFLNVLPATAAKFRVKLVVSSQDFGINEQIRSYVGRELRSLNDVELVEQGYDYQITLTSHRYDGCEQVYGLGALVLDRAKTLRASVVYATPQRFLRQECTEIVVYFDNYVLEPARSNTKR